jgi:hypothetical protein
MIAAEQTAGSNALQLTATRGATTLWEHTAPGWRGVGAGDVYVVVADDVSSSTLTAFEVESGRERWAVETPAVAEHIAGSESFIAVAYATTVEIRSTLDGNLLWSSSIADASDGGTGRILSIRPEANATSTPSGVLVALTDTVVYTD